MVVNIKTGQQVSPKPRPTSTGLYDATSQKTVLIVNFIISFKQFACRATISCIDATVSWVDKTMKRQPAK